MTNKQALQVYRRWSTLPVAERGIFSAYQNPTFGKQIAYEKIRNDEVKLNGFGLSILGRSTYHFTAAFGVSENNSGLLTHLYFYTYKNRYKIALFYNYEFCDYVSAKVVEVTPWKNA